MLDTIYNTAITILGLCMSIGIAYGMYNVWMEVKRQDTLNDQDWGV